MGNVRAECDLKGSLRIHVNTIHKFPVRPLQPFDLLRS